MSKGIVRIAKRGENAKTTADRNLSFSSEWKTPKIFMQTSKDWTNTLGYVPTFMGFRQLNSSVPIGYDNYPYTSGGFTTSDFCYMRDDYMGSDMGWNGVTFDSNGNLSVIKFSGYEWEDENAFAILMLEPLDGEVPSNYELKKGGVFLLAKEGDARTNFPTSNSMDSRFDTLKIALTGTLEIDLPAETIIAGGEDKIYTAEVEHNLGYPPVYLPEAGVGMRPTDVYGFGIAEDFVVNDILGLGNAYAGEPVLDVYVDSNKLYMRYRRQASDYVDIEFNAMTITLYYTIFYNKINEELDLISD